LLVSNRDVSPSENLKQLSIPPEISPIVLFRSASFKDEFVVYCGGCGLLHGSAVTTYGTIVESRDLTELVEQT
jgi:hypothetical protein